MRVAGIMSGTSLDGIDVAVVDVRARGKFAVVKTLHRAYPAKIRRDILAVSNAVAHTSAVSRLNFALGELYAKAVLACGVEGVELIGCHGQTIYHEGVNTLQIGEAAVIAERTGIDVVSNFRERDIAAGGQGAPLVPLFDFLVFRHPTRGRIALNLGGIANITAIPANAEIHQVLAFDTGPANMVVDQLVEIHTSGKRRYDANGAVARTGTISEPLLRDLLRDPYFRRKPPKTAGREQYGADFVAGLQATGLPMPDLIATAAAFTSRTVAMGVRLCPGEYRDLIVGGGGAHNSYLMESLARDTGLAVRTTADFGVDASSKEAVAFALLAYECVYRRPGNIPSATGARKPAVLGKLTRA